MNQREKTHTKRRFPGRNHEIRRPQLRQRQHKGYTEPNQQTAPMHGKDDTKKQACGRHASCTMRHTKGSASAKVSNAANGVTVSVYSSSVDATRHAEASAANEPKSFNSAQNGTPIRSTPKPTHTNKAGMRQTPSGKRRERQGQRTRCPGTQLKLRKHFLAKGTNNEDVRHRRKILQQ